jgi:uncharacterized protein YcbK (DUF882 family)
MDGMPSLRRRRLLAAFAVPLASAFGPLARPTLAATAGERSLRLHHRVTGESLTTTYFVDGHYQEDELQRISWLLRDWRMTRARAVDPHLLDLLWHLDRRLETTAPIQVLCGYRTPETNDWLRHHQKGVSKNSLHMQAMAVDLRLPGHDLRQIRDAALNLKGGGVGYYPRANFIHLDCGPVRSW